MDVGLINKAFLTHSNQENLSSKVIIACKRLEATRYSKHPAFLKKQVPMSKNNNQTIFIKLAGVIKSKDFYNCNSSLLRDFFEINYLNISCFLL